MLARERHWQSCPTERKKSFARAADIDLKLLPSTAHGFCDLKHQAYYSSCWAYPSKCYKRRVKVNMELHASITDAENGAFDLGLEGPENHSLRIATQPGQMHQRLPRFLISLLVSARQVSTSGSFSRLTIHYFIKQKTTYTGDRSEKKIMEAIRAADSHTSSQTWVDECSISKTFAGRFRPSPC